MATIKDVAEKAGLSKTLVSRYINHQKGVSEESKRKIEAAIRELNYRPNGLARSLVLQKTQTIGIVLDNLSSPFVRELIDGFQKGAEDADEGDEYNILFCNSNGDRERKQRYLSYFTQGRVDGIVVYGSLVSDDELIHEIAASSIPFLLIENDIPLDVNKIVIDNLNGAYRATESLIQQGHRKIYHIAGNMNLKITLDRLNGYVQALQHYRIPIESKMIVYPDFQEALENTAEKYEWSAETFWEAGYRSMKQILQRGELPDAVFFAADLSAFGARRALEEAGLSVPNDISFVGFDNDIPAQYGFEGTPITTMKQPLYDAGYLGLKKLIWQIQNPEAKPERTVLLSELILRDSSKERV